MAQPSWIGKTLGGRYEILEELGTGGMSAVYKANDPNLNRIVALKLIHPHLSKDPDFVRRFQAEAEVVAQLRHSNIVQVYDFNNDGEVYFIVFEFVPGETLQGHLKRLNQQEREMPLEEVVKYATQIANALEYAHGRGLVHRDIKPANIILNVYGDAILTDFGIAKIVGGTQHTATGAVLGTARYMAPEQIQGKRIDGRTDLYALGATLYEMVSGKPPYNADSVMTLMMMHVNDPIPEVKRANLPPGLDLVVRRCLAKDPGQRFATAGDFARALQNMDEAPTAAAIPTLMEPDVTGVTFVETPTTPPVQATPVASPQLDPPTVPTVQPDPATLPAQGRAAATVASGGGQAAVPWFKNPLVLGGGGLGAIVLIALILWGTGVIGAGGEATATPDGTTVAVVDEETPEPEEGTAVPDAEPTEEPEEVDATPTRQLNTGISNTEETPEATQAPTNTPRPTATTPPPTPTNPPPTATTAPPTATTAPVGETVSITGISIQDNKYIVNYTTSGYTEQLPGMHVHFYWNNITEDQAGAGPTAASWFLWGGPRPFDGYSVSDRPGNASQMCAVVANADHTIVPGTGNCWTLP